RLYRRSGSVLPPAGFLEDRVVSGRRRHGYTVDRNRQGTHDVRTCRKRSGRIRCGRNPQPHRYGGDEMSIKGALIAAMAAGYFATAVPAAMAADEPAKDKAPKGEKAGCKGKDGCKGHKKDKKGDK